MKVYIYTRNTDRFVGSFLPTDGTDVVCYDSADILDVSIIYSCAVEGDTLAREVMNIWFGM